jgi:hypothetical protein
MPGCIPRQQSRSQQLSRFLNEHRLVALPYVHAAGAELALLDENIERTISWGGPGLTDGWRRDSEHHVLQRTIDEVGVGFLGSVIRALGYGWRDCSSPAWR